MSKLYALCKSASEQLEAIHGNDAMALLRAKGELAAKAGFLVTLVSPGDPDDPQKAAKLRHVAAELGIAI